MIKIQSSHKEMTRNVSNIKENKGTTLATTILTLTSVDPF